MDHRELEEKLEKDNVTLKEHIMKLQNTIKQIKGEITTAEVEHKGRAVVGKKFKDSVRKSSDDEEHLKFSFNNTNMQGNDEKHIDRKVVVRANNAKPGNLYQEGLQKIRNEKDTVLRMEQVKRNANIRKGYSDDSDNELNKFHKNYKERRMSDDEEEEAGGHPHKELHNAPVFKDSKVYFSNPIDYFKNRESSSSFNRIVHGGPEDPYSNNDRSNLKLEDLNKPSKMVNREMRIEYNPSPVQHFNRHLYETNDDFNFKKPSYNTIDKYNVKADDNTSQGEDSFENRVKNIPKTAKSKQPSSKGVTKPVSGVNIVRSPSAKNTITGSTKVQKPINLKKDTLKSPSGMSTPTLFNKTNKKANESGKLATHDVSEMKALKKEIARLNSENSKLKEQLQNERTQNIKFKELAEELIKYYE
jgi:hypothetical protein